MGKRRRFRNRRRRLEREKFVREMYQAWRREHLDLPTDDGLRPLLDAIRNCGGDHEA